MMKSKQSLRNSAKRGLLLSLVFSLSLILGCFSPPDAPTYSREDIAEATQNICKKEYNIGLKARLAGSTLWVYLPLENIFVKPDKPEKYSEKFKIEHNEEEIKNGQLVIEYSIKAVPEQEKYQELKFDQAVADKVGNVWKTIRRVLFSMKDPNKEGVEFICLVIADIKNGIEIEEIVYERDLKKVSYDFISGSEYQHRSTQEIRMSPETVGDKDGQHLKYRGITMEEFVTLQIQHRIRLKFEKPEVEKNADIDKEILKLIIYTLKTYGFKNFSYLELNNLLTENKVILNNTAVWSKSID
ncbi:MAG: hypothetical protein PHQ57_01435 [Candidatus Omnitrophica bacterium]|nr:hypothetical protein [Candidatus Omnitrophota bacterium]